MDDGILTIEEDDIDHVERKYISPYKRKVFDILSIVLSVLAGVVSFVLVDYGVFFIILPILVLDAVLIIIKASQGILLMSHDKKIKSNIPYLKKQIKKLENKNLFKRSREIVDAKCSKCFCLNSRSDGTKYCSNKNCTTYKKHYFNTELLELYKRNLNDLTEKESIEVAKINTKKSAEFDDKILYLNTMEIKIKEFASCIKCKKISNEMLNKTMLEIEKQLNGTAESIKMIEQLLTEKEERLKVIPRTLYVYLDELQLILNQFDELPEHRQVDYAESIQKICIALNENIKHTIHRMETFDVEKLEISLDTLLQELIKENKEETDAKSKD